MFQKLLHSKTLIFVRNTKNYYVLLVTSDSVLMILYFNEQHLTRERWRVGFHDPMKKKPFLSIYE